MHACGFRKTSWLGWLGKKRKMCGAVAYYACASLMAKKMDMSMDRQTDLTSSFSAIGEWRRERGASTVRGIGERYMNQSAGKESAENPKSKGEKKTSYVR